MIRSTAPDAHILFFPYTNPTTKMGEPFDQANLKTKTIFCRTDIISIQTNKTKGGSGQWSATLSPRVNYKSLIQPGTWCMIFMSDEDLTRTEQPTSSSGPSSGFKMLGIVRSVRAIEAIDPGTGTRSLRYELSGDDFQSILDVQVYVNPELRPKSGDDTSAVINSEVYFKKPLSGEVDPGHMVQLIMETLLGKLDGLGKSVLDSNGGKAGGVYAVPPEVAKRVTGVGASGNLFINMIQLGFQPKLLGTVTFQPQLSTMFSLWSMIETYSNKVLNELYTDLLPEFKNGETRLVPTVVLRCIPFTSKAFVPKHKGSKLDIPFLKITDKVNKKSDPTTHLYTSRFIGEDEIFAMNYGKSDAERFNFFFVANNFANDHGLSAWSMNDLLGDDTSKNSQNPLGDANSVARNGLRPYMGSSSYLQLDRDAFIGANIIVRDLWHEAYKYENGQANLVGTKEHIPVGTNVQFKDRGWIAHVEAVSHSYTVSPSGVKNFRTNISFVRLQKLDGTPIDFAKDALSPKAFHHNITSNRGDKL